MSQRLNFTLIVLLFGGSSLLFAEEKKEKPVPLNPEGTVLFDKGNQKLLLKTTVCLRDGLLEMFLCPKQTKEHESILSIDAQAQVIHAGLLALGAKPGRPVQFQPKYQPPTGQKIEIHVVWKDEKGKTHRARAQDWIRHATHRYFEAPLASLPDGVSFPKRADQLIFDDLNHQLIFFGPMTEEQQTSFLKLSDNANYQKAVRILFEQGRPRQMEADFIFAGSGFARLTNGKEAYMADAGSLICVANFGDAMIDVNRESTASNDSGLLFEPWTERVPPLNTEVIVELTPVKEKESPP
ncbi:MAG TPA: YdjY domain-containing protein [Planctomicrobium sp.]|nr:YdjY domain-containing protein [Planctomicrobium sp.]